MATIQKYFVNHRVFQWRSQQPPEIDHGGMFIIRADMYSSTQIIPTQIAARYSESERQCWLDLNLTKQLLGNAIEQLLLVCPLMNLDTMIHELAEDLICKFQFSPELLNDEDARLLFVLELDIYVMGEEDESVDHNIDGLQILDPVVFGDDLLINFFEQILDSIMDDTELVSKIHDDLKEVLDYLEHRGDGINLLKPIEKIMNELKPAYEVDIFSEVDEANVIGTTSAGSGSVDHHSESRDCPICLERLSEGEEVAKTTCSHMFHSTCVMNWLIKADSCPLCRSCFRISF